MLTAEEIKMEEQKLLQVHRTFSSSLTDSYCTFPHFRLQLKLRSLELIARLHWISMQSRLVCTHYSYQYYFLILFHHFSGTDGTRRRGCHFRKANRWKNKDTIKTQVINDRM